MPRDLRIVFMGTPEFAVTTLDALVQKDYTIVGVVTAPDRPAGRGRKLKESAVKQYARTQGFTILQPTNLKNKSFLSALDALDGNLQIVVAFRMLPEVVWRLPKYGTFNLHASLLPNYRGAAPINWAIINGETRTGVTTFFIDEKIDTGEIILQKEVTILSDENAGSLHNKLMTIGSELVLETVVKIENEKVETQSQNEASEIKPAYKLTKLNCKIDWNTNVIDIYNKIRGLSPYPAAWSILSNGTDEIIVKLFSASFEIRDHDHEIGKLIISASDVKIAAKNGFIIIDEIQLSGKRRMTLKSLRNGFEFNSNAKML